MKIENIVLLVLLVVVLGVLAFTFVGFSKDKPSGPSNLGIGNSISQSAFKSIPSGSTSPGEVSIELTPEGVNNGVLRVAISANTHSVDLSQFDLKKITTLEYNGKSVNPVSAPMLAGHHANGELVFNVNEDVKSFTIRIRGIPKVQERVFNW